MKKKSVQWGPDASRRCPYFGVFCFLCAFITSLVGAKSASADTLLAAIRTAPLAAPAAVLGVTNPHVIAAAMKTPKARGFTFSRDLRNLVYRVEKLAVQGVDLNQRKMPHTEKLQLRVDTRTRGVGGILKICYQR